MESLCLKVITLGPYISKHKKQDIKNGKGIKKSQQISIKYIDIKEYFIVKFNIYSFSSNKYFLIHTQKHSIV